jgi:preprotein translocase subunit secB
MEAILKFTGYKIVNLEYSRDIDLLDKDENELEVGVGTAISDDGEQGQVKISVTALDVENKRTVKAEVLGSFDFIDVEDKERTLAVNGTAILYPYVRAIISTITTQDSLNAIILPTVNTLNFLKNEVVTSEE